MNNDRPRSLQDVALIASDKNGGKRGRGLGREMKNHGLVASYTTIDKIIAGTYKSRPGKDLLDGLAILSGVARELVYEVAKEPLPLKPLAEDLPADADLLNASQRKVVIDAVRLFAQQNRELETYRAANREAGTDDGISEDQKNLEDAEAEALTGELEQGPVLETDRPEQG